MVEYQEVSSIVLGGGNLMRWSKLIRNIFSDGWWVSTSNPLISGLLHPWKLTWIPKIYIFESRYIWKPSLFWYLPVPISEASCEEINWDYAGTVQMQLTWMCLKHASALLWVWNPLHSMNKDRLFKTFRMLDKKSVYDSSRKVDNRCWHVWCMFLQVFSMTTSMSSKIVCRISHLGGGFILFVVTPFWYLETWSNFD